MNGQICYELAQADLIIQVIWEITFSFDRVIKVARQFVAKT